MKKIPLLLLFSLSFIYGYSQGVNDFQKLYDNGKYKQVIEQSDKLLSENDTIFNFWYYRGLSQYEMFQYPNAIISLNKALTLTSDTLSVKYLLADIYEKSSNNNEAINIYKQILNLDTTNIHVLAKLGKLHRAELNYPQAVMCYSNLLKIDSTNSYFYSQLATCLSKMGTEPLSGLYHLASYTYDSLNVSYMQNYLASLMKQQLSDSAKAFIDTSLTRFPTNTYLIRNKAFLLTVKEQFLEGIKEFQRAVELGDTSLFTCKYYGQALFENADYDKAIFWLELYLKEKPKDFNNQLLIAIAYQKNYEYEKSLKAISKIFETTYNKKRIVAVLKERINTNTAYVKYLNNRDSLPQQAKKIHNSTFRDLKEAEFLDNNDYWVCKSLADYYYKKEQLKTALFYYEKCYAQKKNSKNKFLIQYYEQTIRNIKEELHFQK